MQDRPRNPHRTEIISALRDWAELYEVWAQSKTLEINGAATTLAKAIVSAETEEDLLGAALIDHVDNHARLSGQNYNDAVNDLLTPAPGPRFN